MHADDDHCPYFIGFDIDKINRLKATYESAMATAYKLLPEGTNWNSGKEITKYFKDWFDIDLKSIQIKELEQHYEYLDHDSTEFLTIYGLTAYLKMKYTVSNYLDCVLKHHRKGVVYLRYFNGKLSMPNRRPLSHSEEVKSCITHTNLKE